MSLWYDQINTKWKGNGIHLWCLNLYIPKICSLWGCWGLDTTERLHFHFSLSCIGEGNGNPLQCSCLENPRGRRAWWADVCGVTQSRTRLKWLSSSSSSTSISVYKNSCPTGCQLGRSWPLNRCLPSCSVAGIWNKANFPFHQPGLFIGFWAVNSQTLTLLV